MTVTVDETRTCAYETCDKPVLPSSKESRANYMRKLYCSLLCSNYAKRGKPNLVSRERNTNLVHDVEELLLHGESPHQIAQRLDRTILTIQRACLRANRKDLARYFDRGIAVGSKMVHEVKTPVNTKGQTGPINDVSHASMRANCYGADVNMFFPEKAEDAAYAKRVCDGCPLLQPCLEVALENREAGIWGGTTSEERASMRRRARR